MIIRFLPLKCFQHWLGIKTSLAVQPPDAAVTLVAALPFLHWLCGILLLLLLPFQPIKKGGTSCMHNS
jgi:hypothetical protein